MYSYNIYAADRKWHAIRPWFRRNSAGGYRAS